MSDPSDFARQLDRLIRERFRTAARFAEAAGCDPTTVTRVTSGERPMPKKLLATWAKVLGLSKTEAEDFIVEGELSDAPMARKRVRTVVARVAELERVVDVLSIQVETLRPPAQPRAGGNPGRPASR